MMPEIVDKRALKQCRQKNNKVHLSVWLFLVKVTTEKGLEAENQRLRPCFPLNLFTISCHLTFSEFSDPIYKI